MEGRRASDERSVGRSDKRVEAERGRGKGAKPTSKLRAELRLLRRADAPPVLPLTRRKQRGVLVVDRDAHVPAALVGPVDEGAKSVTLCRIKELLDGPDQPRERRTARA